MNTLRRIIDFILFFSFCFLTGSGIMMKFSFVKGVGKQTVLGLGKGAWCDWHLWIGVLMFIALIAHIFVNRVWIAKVGTGNRVWMAILLAILGVGIVSLLSFALTTIVPTK